MVFKKRMFKIIKTKKGLSRLWWGLVFLLLSFLPLFTPDSFKSTIVVTLASGLYCLGVAFLFDYLALIVSGNSFLQKILKKGVGRVRYFLIALLVGFILEFFATYLGGLWVYPFYSLSKYFLVAFLAGGFGWYFLCILISYEAFKSILDKLLPGKRFVTKDYKYEKWFYKILLILGVCGFAVFLFGVVMNAGELERFVLDVSHVKVPYISFWDIMLVFVSSFFVLEFIEYKKHRTSFLKDTLHGYLNPLLAIILCSVILGLYMETQNVPIGVWYYTNWPLQDFTIYHIPVVVYLIGWPAHYIFFLSFYRAFGDRRSSVIFSGDKVA